MFFSKHRRRFVSNIVLLLLIGMQTSFAVNAGFQFSPQAKLDLSQTKVAAPSCHRGSVDADQTRRECRLHCVTDSQSVTQFDLPVLPNCLKAAPILTLQAPHVVKHILPSAWGDAISTDPPIPIRFCSFQI
jgi:hypothetical protein